MVKLGEIPTRTCTVCKTLSHDLTKFVKNKGSKYGVRNLCLKCVSMQNNAHTKQKDWKTDHQTKKRYGISVEEYKKAMSSSNCCEICGKTEELCYDHCHDTMKFRGILCRGCNRSIGQLGDNAKGIQKVLAYLTK